MFGTLWLRLYRKWRYASTSIEYRASQILYLLLSPLLLLFDADMLFCFNHRDILPEMNMSTTEKKPNKSKIFNANMVQPNTKSAIVFEEKKQKLCCIRCEMRLKISHITDFVNCLNGGLLVFCASSLTHSLHHHSMMINIFSRFMTTENPSRPKKNVSRFCFGYHWTHSHIDSDFNFLLRSIHPFKSIICFCYGRHRNLFLLFPSHSLCTFPYHFWYILLSFVWLSHFANCTHEIEDRIILSENPLNQKWYG